VEAETYIPPNLFDLQELSTKDELMADYHKTTQNGNLFEFRFYYDGNVYYTGDEHNLRDLVKNVQWSYGKKNVQISFENGTVTGKEYLGLGLKSTTFDNKFLKRGSAVAMYYPSKSVNQFENFVLGFEYTTQEVEWEYPGIILSSTGTGRLILPTGQTVVQGSVWFSTEKMDWLYIGIEYEYNNASHFNDITIKEPHELYLGFKIEFNKIKPRHKAIN
jgi:hypothetical protein